MLSIQKKSLVDMVYDKLRESIIQLQLPLGSKLNVNELRDRMGVSCTPIREAINRLATFLAKYRQRHGTDKLLNKPSAKAKHKAEAAA